MYKRLNKYLDRTLVGRLDFFRQLIFVTYALLAVILFSLHLCGSYGLAAPPALACSACYVGVSVAALCVYLWKGPHTMRLVLPSYLVAATAIQSVRLVTLAATGQSQPMLTAINLTVCFVVVFITSMSMFPYVALACTAANILALAVCGVMTGAEMYWQLLTVFGVMEIVTTAFCFVSQKLLYEEHTELVGYVNTVDQILRVFNISKTELVTLLQLAKARDSQTVFDKNLLSRLDPKTVRNIIQTAEHIEDLQTNLRETTLERFPTLSPSELDVCRLVERGLTLKEIANALGKSPSNVSTVRGNIRKKLGLSQDDDLRSFLLGKGKYSKEQDL